MDTVALGHIGFGLHARISTVLSNQVSEGSTVSQLLIDFINGGLHGVQDSLISGVHICLGHRGFGFLGHIGSGSFGGVSILGFFLLLQLGGQVFVVLQQVVIHGQQDVGNAPVSFRHIVGSLTIVLGHVLIVSHIALIGGLVGFHLGIEGSLHFVIRYFHVLDHLVANTVVPFFFQGALHHDIFGVAHGFQSGQCAGLGSQLFFIGGLIGQVAVVGHIAVHQAVPAFGIAGLQGLHLFIGELIQTPLGSLLIHQGILDGIVQSKLIDKLCIFIGGGIIAVLAVGVGQIGSDVFHRFPEHRLPIHGSHHIRRSGGCGFRGIGGGCFICHSGAHGSRAKHQCQHQRQQAGNLLHAR